MTGLPLALSQLLVGFVLVAAAALALALTAQAHRRGMNRVRRAERRGAWAAPQVLARKPKGWWLP